MSRPWTAPAARWVAWMLGGLVPVLVVGFVASALADRLIFLAWALAAAALYVVSLRRAFGAAAALTRRGIPLAVLGLSFGLFAALAAAYGGELADGFAAMLPPAAP